MTKQELVDAIRNHPLIGRGSCTTIDECYDANEIWEKFGLPGGYGSIEAAIAAAIKSEDLHMEKALDCRFGDDDDAELKINDEWEAAKQALKESW
jgi:hypothetical protein